MALLIMIAANVVLYVIPTILVNNDEWLGLGVYLGGLALTGLCVVSYFILRDALERRAYRETVQRLIALERASSCKEWTLPAPESYVLFAGVSDIESDAFTLGLMQLVAMGALSPDGDSTILKRGQTPVDAHAGSLGAIYRLWAACAEQPVDESEGQVVEAQAQEAE